MGYVPDWSRQDHKKSSGGKAPEGIKHGTSLFHSGKAPAPAARPKAFLADGGEVEEAALKAEGLKASEGEKVGFFDRLKAGNIDEAGSEANMKFGSGRGNTERQVVAARSELDTGMYSVPKSAPDVSDTPELQIGQGRVATRDEYKDYSDTPELQIGQGKASTRKEYQTSARRPAARKPAAAVNDPIGQAADVPATPPVSVPAAAATAAPVAPATAAERSLNRGKKFKEYLRRQFSMTPGQYADGGMVKGKRKC